MDETPMTWLFDELRARGMTDLIGGYLARQRSYQKMLTKRSKDELRLSREELSEELRARREKASEE